MELTGKCKEEFEMWFMSSKMWGLVVFTVSSYYHSEDEIDFDDVFNKLPDSAKYGVYIDYFDSVGIVYDSAVVRDSLNTVNTYEYTLKTSKDLLILSQDCFDTRHEARTAAIEKANEIFNNK